MTPPTWNSPEVQRAIDEERADYERRLGLLSPASSPEPLDGNFRAADNPFQTYPPAVPDTIPALPAPADTHPFLVTAFNDSGTLKFRVAPGTFNGNMPTLGGTALDDPTPPVGTLGTGTKHVYLHISATLTATHDYVNSNTFDTFVISSGSSVPSNDTTNGEYYIPLATFTDGQKTAQLIVTSLDGFIEDDGTASSQGDLYTFQT